MSKMSQEELKEYIGRENLAKVFPILIYQIILAEARSEMIIESTQKLKKCFMDIENSTSTEQSFIKPHVHQLDLISKIFMFLEDYLTYKLSILIQVNKTYSISL